MPNFCVFFPLLVIDLQVITIKFRQYFYKKYCRNFVNFYEIFLGHLLSEIESK